MIKGLFGEVLALSDELRRGYRDSLGGPAQAWEQALGRVVWPIPELFREIYGTVSGTLRGVKEQRLMDFVPGYRLIHVEELEAECAVFAGMAGVESGHEAGIELAVPFLADYSSNYICYVKTRDGAEAVFGYSLEDGFQERHASVGRFFETVAAFYREGVYFLDDHGFLDYDFEKEGVLGKRLNPGIGYWSE